MSLIRLLFVKFLRGLGRQLENTLEFLPILIKYCYKQTLFKVRIIIAVILLL
jgi:hypothetical protein